MKGGRRALSHLGGETDTWGDPAAARFLGEAFSSATDDGARAHVHAFHSYPAKLHPDIARALAEGLCSPGGVVLDPFMGSGTVLVESRLAGHQALGTDLNPIAVQLTALKAEGRSAAARTRLVAAAQRVADLATERRKAKVGASRRYPPVDVELFAPHVLLALDALKVGIVAEPDAATRRDLWLVLSSILTKLGRRRGDSSEGMDQKQIARSFPARLFAMRATELASQLTELERLMPAGAPLPSAVLGDARELRHVAGGSVDLVLTSPPYPGNYDYLAHHRDRLRWLELDGAELDRGELGARRHLEAAPARAREAWSSQLTAALRAIDRVLKPDGLAALVLADSAVGRAALYEDDLVAAAADLVGLRVIARASQPRPHFHGPTMEAFARRPRREHVIMLGKKRR